MCRKLKIESKEIKISRESERLRETEKFRAEMSEKQSFGEMLRWKP